MKRFSTVFVILFIFAYLCAQEKPTLSFKLEELSSPQFVKAIEFSKGVCIIPMGIIEKHGPHLPLGSDIFEAREVANNAAKTEYSVVYPSYYFGQIFEATHQAGTIAYSNDLIWKVLEETCSELSRNGFKKIILLNGHGGNNSFLEYFCQSQLASPRDYVVVLFKPSPTEEQQNKISNLKKSTIDGHAGEDETSMMYYINPALVDIPAIKTESGLDQDKLTKLPFGYTGIWWYSKFPNHFAGDNVNANKELGELLIKTDAEQLIELIRFLKKDDTIQLLQDEFYKRRDHSVKTKP